MRSDEHESFQRRIDETLTGDAAVGEEESLREHLQSCTQCQEYFAASTRVIAGLGGFSFDVDPALQEQVCAAISLRVRQIESGQPSRRRMAWICIIALLLSAAGSFIDLQFSGLIASVLDMQRTQMRHGLVTFWILPSFCFLLLFPILPLLSHRKERVI
jgi:predicted anti-sigma-YlaC factor YlaD